MLMSQVETANLPGKLSIAELVAVPSWLFDPQDHRGNENWAKKERI